MTPIKDLIRTNIYKIKGIERNKLSSTPNPSILHLDHNENPYNAPFNRFPDSYENDLYEKMALTVGVNSNQVFATHGIACIIDSIMRMFCKPLYDCILCIEPASLIYKKIAWLNNIDYKTVDLEDDFTIKADKIRQHCTPRTRIIIISSPNTLAGNLMKEEELIKIADSFEGIVLIDQTYAGFTRNSLLSKLIKESPNIILLYSFNHVWACAALNVGLAIANTEIIDMLKIIRSEDNINTVTKNEIIRQIQDPTNTERYKNIIMQECLRAASACSELSFCKKVFPTDANFFLARFDNAEGVYLFLLKQHIVVKNCTKYRLCANCLRFSIGKKTDNNKLLAVLRQFNDNKTN